MSVKAPAIFASDLHGNRYAYDALFAYAEEHKIETVILGGDLTPKWPVICFFDGAIVPLEPRRFKVDANQKTLCDFLAETEPLVGKNRAKAEKHFTWLGGYIVHTGTRMSYEQMRQEQEVLRKMIDNFDRHDSDTKPKVVLSAAEFVTLMESLRILDVPIDKNPAASELRYLTLSVEQRAEVERALDEASKAVTKVMEGKTPEAIQFLRPALYGGLFSRRPTRVDEIVSQCGLSAEHGLLNTWMSKAREYHRSLGPQKSFLRTTLANRIKQYKKKVKKGTVYLILGNDDQSECDEVVKRMAERGIVKYISNSWAETASGLRIAGYPYVRNSNGQFYDAWEKAESEIEDDLNKLEASAGSDAVFVVHTPAADTQLDYSFGNNHYGSRGVRNWLANKPKRLALHGHIHEAPFLNGGFWREKIDGTWCMQPGAWHDEGLCAVVVDLMNPEDSTWIHDESKIKR